MILSEMRLRGVTGRDKQQQSLSLSRKSWSGEWAEWERQVVDEIYEKRWEIIAEGEGR